MSEPDIDLDGWCLDDGEARHREAPATFQIPGLEQRQELKPGDLAKLIFHIAVDSDEKPFAVERMWVLVREKVGERYLGVLDNDPDSIEENDEFWSGIELPFSARHVIDIELADEATRALAMRRPTRMWDRS